MLLKCLPAEVQHIVMLWKDCEKKFGTSIPVSFVTIRISAFLKASTASHITVFPSKFCDLRLPGYNSECYLRKEVNCLVPLKPLPDVPSSVE